MGYFCNFCSGLFSITVLHRRMPIEFCPTDESAIIHRTVFDGINYATI